jgi:hypothetical protein
MIRSPSKVCNIFLDKKCGHFAYRNLTEGIRIFDARFGVSMVILILVIFDGHPVPVVLALTVETALDYVGWQHKEFATTQSLV